VKPNVPPSATPVAEPFTAYRLGVLLDCEIRVPLGLHEARAEDLAPAILEDAKERVIRAAAVVALMVEQLLTAGCGARGEMRFTVPFGGDPHCVPINVGEWPDG
jgi:hypothetical protein